MKLFKYIMPILILIVISYSCNNNIKREYYESGELKTEAEYNNDGLKHGIYKEYYKNGNVSIETEYEYGKLNGCKKVFFQDGGIDWYAEFKDNLESGLCKDYDKKGNLITEGYFRNGKQDSVLKEFYPDGNLKKEVFYKDGIIHGSYISYYTNGQKSFDAHLDMGETIFYNEYDSVGNIISELKNCLEFVDESFVFNIVFSGNNIKLNKWNNFYIESNNDEIHNCISPMIVTDGILEIGGSYSEYRVKPTGVTDKMKIKFYISGTKKLLKTVEKHVN